MPMQINIASSYFNRDSVATQLVDELEEAQTELELEEAHLYYHFPLFKELDENADYPSFMIISPNHGIILIQTDERSYRSLDQENMEALIDQISQIHSSVFSKLIKIPRLRKQKSRTQLNLEIYTVLYLPNYGRSINFEEDGIFYANSFASLRGLFEEFDSQLNEESLRDIFSVIEGTKGIPKPKDRNITEEKKDSKGGLLEQLEKEIATFDEKQKIAALTQIDGPQRIRGLAGSGKTIVLAMKAALIHLRNPDVKILYTFYTKSLYDHIKRLITRFYRMHEDRDPNWDKIHIRHAWGGTSLPGVYYDACRDNQVYPLNYGNVKNKLDPFDYVCRDLLEKTGGALKKTYDYVLLDEGQDFKPSFYWLCRKIVKNDCLVWAYDELQNIMNVEMQQTVELFKNKYGDEGIDLARLQENYPRQNNDIVLHKSYRNPREILVVAHAIGFGIYNEHILQILENKEHWHDVGYEVTKGECVEGEVTIINRPKRNSPLTISEKQTLDEIIQTYTSNNGMNGEVQWVCESIRSNIEENLLPEDILVVCIDDKYARDYFNRISDCLSEMGISSNNLFNSYTGDEFIVEGSVTLSTVYRAKGNEAAVVYVIGTDTFKNNKDNIVTRNKIFTAFTRAKAWLRVTGSNTHTATLFSEIQEALENAPDLIFTYPDVDSIKTLRRELAEANEKKLTKLRKLQDMIDDLGLSEEEAIDLLNTGRKKGK